MAERFDKVIIGAGLYGLYAARFCALKGQKVCVLEYDKASFQRATYINQARVHMGYHYPRSLTTAIKSAGYFKRFCEDFEFCIHKEFRQIYAISNQFSWTSGKQFQEFCRAAEIPCEEVPVSKYFNLGICDGAFLTKEYTYDAGILRDFYTNELEKYSNVEIHYGVRIQTIQKIDDNYEISLEDGSIYTASFILNATYASVNQLIEMAGGGKEEQFDIKYELCEIILCKPSKAISDIGITVMDGPFFSIMPFGKTGLHSLTSVTFTPHVTSYDRMPHFRCQAGTSCTTERLNNCNQCINKPASAWPYMSHLADKYLKPEYSYSYVKSLFSMKPILKSSEVDDSRPTAIKTLGVSPTFLSVLSGKINTVYDLDAYLE